MEHKCEYRTDFIGKCKFCGEETTELLSYDNRSGSDYIAHYCEKCGAAALEYFGFRNHHDITWYTFEGHKQ